MYIVRNCRSTQHRGKRERDRRDNTGQGRTGQLAQTMMTRKIECKTFAKNRLTISNSQKQNQVEQIIILLHYPSDHGASSSVVSGTTHRAVQLGESITALSRHRTPTPSAVRVEARLTHVFATAQPTRPRPQR